MHAEVRVLLDAVVEAVRLPGVREEDERDRLPEVVELQAARADGVHDACVVDDARGDVQGASAEEDVGVGGRAEGVADDEEGGCYVAS